MASNASPLTLIICSRRIENIHGERKSRIKEMHKRGIPINPVSCTLYLGNVKFSPRSTRKRPGPRIRTSSNMILFIEKCATPDNSLRKAAFFVHVYGLGYHVGSNADMKHGSLRLVTRNSGYSSSAKSATSAMQLRQS